MPGMKKHLRLAFAVLLVGIVATQVSGDDVQKDQKALQGTWKPAADEGEIKEVKFDGETFVVTMKEGVFKGKFKIHADMNPRGIDMIVEEAPEDGYKGKTSLGIYKVEGGALTWCANAPGREQRPPEFAREVGDATFMLIELKKK